MLLIFPSVTPSTTRCVRRMATSVPRTLSPTDDHVRRVVRTKRQVGSVTLSLELAAERLQVNLPQGRPSLRGGGGADSPRLSLSRQGSRPGSAPSTPRAARRLAAVVSTTADAVATVGSITIHQVRNQHGSALLHLVCRVPEIQQRVHFSLLS